MLANVREALHELLSLLEAPSEAAPGTFNGFVRVGKHELGLEVQLAEGNLVLRAFPEDVLTARLKAHPSVAAGLGTFTDLVRARLFEYAGRLALEVKLAGIPPGRFRPVLRGVTIDCARLRGAAEGLVAAAAKNALIASPITKTKLRLPPPGAASPASNVTRSRLGMLDELQQAVGKDSAPLKKGFVNRGARLTVEHGPGEGLQFVINERASYTIGRSSDADLTIRDHSISRKNSLLAWEDDRLYIEDLNSANGTRVNNISVSRSEIEDGDLFEVGESTLRVERIEPAVVPVVPKTPAPVVPAPKLRPPAAPVALAPQARLPEPSLPAPAPVVPATPALTPPEAAAPPAAEQPAPAKKKITHVTRMMKVRASAFFGDLVENANKSKTEDTDAAGEESKLVKKKAGSRFSTFFDDPAAEVKVKGKGKGTQPPSAASTVFKDGDVENALSWMESEDGGEGFDFGFGQAPEPPPEDLEGASLHGRGRTGGEAALSWMDEVPEASAPSAGGGRRRVSLALPEKILPNLKLLARDWFRQPERTTLKGEIRVEDEVIWVQTGFEPGDRTWRYRKPTLKIGSPPEHLPSGTFYPEPTELSHEEVATWLLSEGLIDEAEVQQRAHARTLLEEAWILRADGDPDQALERLQTVLDLYDDDLKALTTIGHLCRKELDDAERAEQYYARALDFAPRYVPSLLGQAMLLLPTDRHRAAEAAVQALALAPKDPDALELAGLVTVKAGRRARARELFLRLFRIDRDRGQRALSLLDAERGGSNKWDPRLVMTERRRLEEGDLDSITQALYEERVATADKLDRYIEDYRSLSPDERVSKLGRLGQLGSYSFFADLLPLYNDEPREDIRRAIQEVFLGAPNQSAQALEDAIQPDMDPDAAAAAVAIASHLHWTDLLPQALELFRCSALPREVRRLLPPLVRLSGGDVALALLAKLMRGMSDCRDALIKVIRQLGPRTPEAVEALREVLQSESTEELSPADRVVLERALATVGAS